MILFPAVCGSIWERLVLETLVQSDLDGGVGLFLPCVCDECTSSQRRVCTLGIILRVLLVRRAACLVMVSYMAVACIDSRSLQW